MINQYREDIKSDIFAAIDLIRSSEKQEKENIELDNLWRLYKALDKMEIFICSKCGSYNKRTKLIYGPNPTIGTECANCIK